MLGGVEQTANSIDKKLKKSKQKFKKKKKLLRRCGFIQALIAANRKEHYMDPGPDSDNQ